MGTGVTAIWYPVSGDITREEMSELREQISEAIRKGEGTLEVVMPDGREITLLRFIVPLPVFIESPDWREAEEFAAALAERKEAPKRAN